MASLSSDQVENRLLKALKTQTRALLKICDEVSPTLRQSAHLLEDDDVDGESALVIEMADKLDAEVAKIRAVIQ